MNKENLHFFLGGNDLEMQAIKQVLDKAGVSYSDANLSWGTTTAAYNKKIGNVEGWGKNRKAYDAEKHEIGKIVSKKNVEGVPFEVVVDDKDKVIGIVNGSEIKELGAGEIAKVAEEGKTPVVIELTDVSPYTKLPENTVVVDHHGSKSQNKASILQVCDLLGIKATRDMQLVAANDSGYIPAMLEIGATKEEVDKIRLADRKCQGIKDEEEKQAEEALKKMVKVPFGEDELIMVKLPHSRTATVADRLFEKDKPQNLAILSADGEINYYGHGDICEKLTKEFGGWSGGAGYGKADGSGYWGAGGADAKKVFRAIIDMNQERTKMSAENSHTAALALNKFMQDKANG